MKPEEQRIALASIVPGWRVSHGGKYICVGDHPTLPGIFDPLNDLNAMHEAENICITSDNSESYTFKLVEAMGDDPDFIWSATAAQRAEALLKTLNLWEEL